MASELARHRASVMRVPVPHGGKASAILVPRPMGYLAVRLFLDGQPVAGLPVGFFHRDAEGDKGDSVGDVIPTDARGVARLPRLVANGSYRCEVTGQDAPAIVSTVSSLAESVPVLLPIGAESVDGHLDQGNDEDGGEDVDSDGADGETSDSESA